MKIKSIYIAVQSLSLFISGAASYKMVYDSDSTKNTNLIILLTLPILIFIIYKAISNIRFTNKLIDIFKRLDKKPFEYFNLNDSARDVIKISLQRHSSSRDGSEGIYVSVNGTDVEKAFIKAKGIKYQFLHSFILKLLEILPDTPEVTQVCASIWNQNTNKSWFCLRLISYMSQKNYLENISEEKFDLINDKTLNIQLTAIGLDFSQETFLQKHPVVFGAFIGAIFSLFGKILELNITRISDALKNITEFISK